ncbi:host attachment protein [Hydrocarboniphaga effusa]|jgi:protein required for attachment to host cells|uniref:host attachment protein n=1 Tax=Hydrocarboniphaga effusa TaxID=243629 RepID=UPI00058B8F23|nr:host attachment protein [Hydrocarboniphaga effusa]
MSSPQNKPVGDRRSRSAVVVAADAAIARLFLARNDAEWTELDDLTNPAAHADERELVADAAGRRGASTTQSGNSAYGGGSMKAHRIEEFAAEVCKRVAISLRETQAEQVHLIAEPHFLGLLRQRLDAEIRKRVGAEVSKSLARHSPEQIRAALPDDVTH